MKKYIAIVFFAIVAIFVIVVAYVGFNVIWGSPVRVENMEITPENIVYIQKRFLDFKLPSGAKIEKATKLISNGALLFVKVVIPEEKIDEFNSDFFYDDHLPFDELDYEVFKIPAKSIDWWHAEKSEIDYMIMSGGSSDASMKFIYLKPENGMVTVFMQQ